MVENLSLLGSTGSIGTQALEVVRELNIKVCALAAHRNIDLLEKQAREFKPEVVAVYDEKAASQLKQNICDLDTRVRAGMDGLCEAASKVPADTVLNAVVGMIGLEPTLEAIKSGKDIALANKETLVTGGKLVMDLAHKKGIKLLPVDSEHSAIFQCLQGCYNKSDLRRIILTASGGPFFGKTKGELRGITKEQALNHPTWNMGAKITIDSATMMNKGLEIIEAKWLFDVDEKDIDVLIHKQSIVHSLIEYKDNSVIAQLGTPDMKMPIRYALTYPRRYVSSDEPLSLAKVGSLTFFPPDEDSFVCFKACREALKRGGLAPVAVNGANEQAVELFLKNKISFIDIGNLVYSAMCKQQDTDDFTLKDIIEADRQAREFVMDSVNMR